MGNSESIIPGKPHRIISKEGLAYAGMCAHGLFWDEMTCLQISHLHHAARIHFLVPGVWEVIFLHEDQD